MWQLEGIRSNLVTFLLNSVSLYAYKFSYIGVEFMIMPVSTLPKDHNSHLSGFLLLEVAKVF